MSKGTAPTFVTHLAPSEPAAKNVWSKGAKHVLQAVHMFSD